MYIWAKTTVEPYKRLDLHMKTVKPTDRRAYHVVGGDEGVVDGDELDILALEGHPGHEPPDPSETWTKSQSVDSDLNLAHGEWRCEDDETETWD
jgi:hypothetical protein